MSIFYDNLPFPLFIGITVIVPILILLYFHKKKSEYPTTFLVGMVFLCLTAFSAAVVRVFIEYRLYEKYLHWFGAIPIPFVLFTIPFIMVGAYQKVKHDEVQRKKILLFSLIQLLIILFIVFLAIFKPWE
ncbi:hypothetical protein ACFSTH_07165 [Paenibacillus yanchengensis]|uniref:Uncharacterized protein n=1 Tax=Paenibacillus yanchengensis TaxID=2035833 RepID=A0ABW4YHS4_9BACL